MKLQDHQRIGKFLQRIRNELNTMGTELENFGKSKESMLLYDVIDLMDTVRSQLDDSLFREYPDIDSKTGCKYYY